MQGLLVLYPSMVRRRASLGLSPFDLEQRVTEFTRLLLDGFRARIH